MQNTVNVDNPLVTSLENPVRAFPYDIPSLQSGETVDNALYSFSQALERVRSISVNAFSPLKKDDGDLSSEIIQYQGALSNIRSAVRSHAREIYKSTGGWTGDDAESFRLTFMRQENNHLLQDLFRGIKIGDEGTPVAWQILEEIGIVPRDQEGSDNFWNNGWNDIKRGSRKWREKAFPYQGGTVTFVAEENSAYVGYNPFQNTDEINTQYMDEGRMRSLIYAWGVGVGQGYPHRPDLGRMNTAKFLANPKLHPFNG